MIRDRDVARDTALHARLPELNRRRARQVMAEWNRLRPASPAANGHRAIALDLLPSRRSAEHVDVLAVEDLSIRFGGVQALSDVHLVARSGEVTGVIGPNGAGKSTLFNCLSGLLMPDRGRLIFDGEPLRGSPASRGRRGLGRTFQTPRLFPSLSVLANLLFGCEIADWCGRRYVFNPGLGRLAAAERASRIARMVGYEGDLSIPAGALPFGAVRTVELARTLCGAPRLLMLDEPASGLDAQQARTFVALMRRLADCGLAILLIEHDMGLVMDLCERITVLDFGQVLAEGSPDEVQRNQAVIHAYLGRRATRA